MALMKKVVPLSDKRENSSHFKSSSHCAKSKLNMLINTMPNTEEMGKI